MFRYCELLDPWALSDVLLIGGGIGFERIDSQIPVRIDPEGWCFVAAAVMTMLTRAALSVGRSGALSVDLATTQARTQLAVSSAIWCCCLMPRVARVHRCRPHAISRTLALLIAAVVLTPLAYPPPHS